MDLFDDLAQALARGVSRRQALQRFAGGVTAAVLGTMLPWRQPSSAAASQRVAWFAPGFDVSGGSVPGGAGMLPYLRYGDSGPQVEALEYLLRYHQADASSDNDNDNYSNDNEGNDNSSGRLEVDGYFGGQTDRAVRSFQRSNGLTVDGVVGPITWSALFVTVRRGDEGPAVKAVETLLNAHGLDIEVDGDFGNETEDAVKSFQQSKGLLVDGIVGPQTWPALVSI